MSPNRKANKANRELTLPPLRASFSPRPGPLLLIIMDGIGIGRPDDTNAVYLARTPTLDRLWRSQLHTTLQAHGTAVGLPSDEDMGNSEVGHNALGAGRVFAQGAKLVNLSLETGRLFAGEVWQRCMARSRAGGTLHFIGLHSDGYVHSHTDQLYALLRQAVRDGTKRGRLHLLHDGRDVEERSALRYLAATEKVLTELRAQGADFRIASGGGRMVTTMDRYFADWRVVQRGWETHVLGRARHFSSAAEAVAAQYAENPAITDQYLPPFVIVEDGKPVGTIENGDSVIFFNFRGDRAIEISLAFQKDFDQFNRERVPEVFYAGMMEYDGDLHIPEYYLVEPPAIDRTISQYLAAAGVTMFACSETQKYGHVTYFWNGNNSGYVDEKLELYHEIPSDRIEFDKAPKMKAPEITEWTAETLRSGQYRFGRINFANGDMVGHTGVMPAAIAAVETVDQCVSRLLEVNRALGGITVVTADHGNCDEMYTVKGSKKEIKTAHTLNPVPFTIVDPAYAGEYVLADREKRGLSHVAATILNLLGFEAPTDYDLPLIRFER